MGVNPCLVRIGSFWKGQIQSLLRNVNGENFDIAS